MLARLAENLFWAGRYTERAEDTARMLDVTYHTQLESPSGEADEAWEQLLEVLHLRAAYTGPLRSRAVMRYLMLDPDNPGSVTASVSRARENTRSVRELVSQELWEAINDLHLMLGARDLMSELEDQPYDLFRAVRRASMTIYGVASETMPRDEAWRFMALGRLLERAEMTCRLIDVRYVQLVALSGPSQRLGAAGSEAARGPDRRDFHHWIAVLKSASAFEAYRRRYRASMDPADVVEFLLLEPDLPRSVLYSLRSARFQLDALRDGRPSRAARQLGRTGAALEFRDVAELFDVGLSTFLEDVQLQIAEVAESVAAEFFHHHPPGSLHAIATG